MKLIKNLLPIYLILLGLFVGTAFAGSRVVTVAAESASIVRQHVFVIDPGHGGIDGGATSCTGVLESQLNLEISLRLNDLIHLLGYETCMIRTTDESVYTQGETIAAKKVSDLKHRVQMVNEAENAVLISLHQNQFSDSRYSGAQVFYAKDEESRKLAQQLQSAFLQTINPDSHRKIKKAEGIYLLEHIQSPGILIECGFLSNPREEAALRSDAYQKKMCTVIACVLSTHFGSELS